MSLPLFHYPKVETMGYGYFAPMELRIIIYGKIEVIGKILIILEFSKFPPKVARLIHTIAMKMGNSIYLEEE
jgi:hypothetical protein